MDVHAGAVVAEDRLGHEGGGLARAARRVLDDVLVEHHAVGHAQQRVEAHVDLALPTGGDLVVLRLDGDAAGFHRQHHRGAQVLQRVVRRDGEVAFLRAHAVAEVGAAVPAGVPVRLVAVHHGPLLVLRGAVLDVVEDEELGLGAEVGGVGDAGLG